LPSAEAGAAAESPELDGGTAERSLRKRFVEAARNASVYDPPHAPSSPAIEVVVGWVPFEEPIAIGW